jgi:putative transcriptional regulator
VAGDDARAMSAEGFAGLLAGMDDVAAFYRGERKGFTVHSAHDIKAIREKTKLSQPKFAAAFHLDVATLRDWEQGRRQPERSAQVLLELIEREPETIQRILAVGSARAARKKETVREAGIRTAAASAVAEERAPFEPKKPARRAKWERPRAQRLQAGKAEDWTQGTLALAS